MGYTLGRRYTLSDFSRHRFLAERRLRTFRYIRRWLILEPDLGIVDDLSLLILTVVSPIDTRVIRRHRWDIFRVEIACNARKGLFILSEPA